MVLNPWECLPFAHVYAFFFIGTLKRAHAHIYLCVCQRLPYTILIFSFLHPLKSNNNLQLCCLSYSNIFKKWMFDKEFLPTLAWRIIVLGLLFEFELLLQLSVLIETHWFTLNRKMLLDWLDICIFLILFINGSNFIKFRYLICLINYKMNSQKLLR